MFDKLFNKEYYIEQNEINVHKSSNDFAVPSWSSSTSAYIPFYFIILNA